MNYILAGSIGTIFILAAFSKKKEKRMIFPLDGPAIITSPFGDGRKHNGIDIKASIDSLALSPLGGKVLNVYYADAGGLQMLIKHDNGMISGYAHLNRAPLKIGERVKRGEVVAYTGNSGKDTTGPHLHYTLRVNGEYVDPLKYLAKAV